MGCSHAPRVMSACDLAAAVFNTGIKDDKEEEAQYGKAALRPLKQARECPVAVFLAVNPLNAIKADFSGAAPFTRENAKRVIDEANHRLRIVFLDAARMAAGAQNRRRCEAFGKLSPLQKERMQMIRGFVSRKWKTMLDAYESSLEKIKQDEGNYCFSCSQLP
jgi:hypothetical protein